LRYYGSLMKKECAVLLLLLLSMLVSIPKISLVKAWTGVVYIRADDSVDPPTAPIQRNGDLYTLTGNITSDTAGIVIERNNMVLDGAGYTIQGLGGSGSQDHAGIILTGRNQVTIRNANITEFSYGIRVYQSTSVTISGSSLTSNLNWGIYLWSSDYNTISENNITENNNQGGIYLSDSSNNNVTGNNIANSRRGLVLDLGSINNRILGNTFTNDGLQVYAYYGNIVEGNVVNGKPLVYLEGVSDRAIDNAGQVILINCDNIRVENLNLSSTSVGLQLEGTNNSKIANNNMVSNVYGIDIRYSSNNSIMGNKIAGNEIGVDLHFSSKNGIARNNVIGNIFGVWLVHSPCNKITGNNITANEHSGLRLGGSSDYNMVSRNSLVGNNYGISFDGPSGNNIYENNITLNHEYGIYLYQSSDNKFYHNNFVANINQVFTFDSVNVWDDGYFSGGNYWSDYSIVDEKSGPNQDQPGSDGIGDIPYNSDHYPLMDIYSIVSAYPIAAFTYLPSDPIAGQTVVFDASDSTCQNGIITTYYWSFDDGAFSGGSVVTHKYVSYGSYNITLTVISNSRISSNQTQAITIRENPTARFHYVPAVNVTVGQSVTFDASLSTPRGGTIETYIWDFGDGNRTSTPDPIVLHNYPQGKTYNVTLTVVDSEGLNSSYFQMIKVWMFSFISISSSSSSSVIGFAVDINGTLHDVYGNGLDNQTVIFYYTFSGAGTWFPITSHTTDSYGKYRISWIPPATGDFTIKAEWVGNTTHFGASNTISMSTISFQNQYIFSVESNSTISDLTFDTTSRRLNFTVSGENNTTGYSKVTIAKILITDITKLKVHIDGVEYNYTVTETDDSWILTFTYTHSTHYVTINLGSAMTGGPLDLTLWIFLISILIVISFMAGIIMIKRRKQKLKKEPLRSVSKN